MKQAIDVDLAAFNKLVREREIPAVVAKSPKDAKAAPPPTP